MALGELIYEHTGRVIGQRVLSVKEEERPKIKSSSINNLVGVFEYEVDESGSTRAKVWEWK
jgi:GNAT superfamily N-acetyltransferase